MSLNLLPLDTITIVDKFLSFSEHLQLMLVNTIWFNLLNSDWMWRGRITQLDCQLSIHGKLLNREEPIKLRAESTNIREILMKIYRETKESVDRTYKLKECKKIKKLKNTWSSYSEEIENFETFCENFKLEEYANLLKESEPIRCCFIGPHGIGKTTLCYYLHLRYERYNDSEEGFSVPRYYNSCDIKRIEGYCLQLVDTPYSYDTPSKCHIFIMCYSISNPVMMNKCLKDFSDRFLPEIQPFLDYNRSVLVVGTKSDICDYSKPGDFHLGKYWNSYLCKKYDSYGKKLSQRMGAVSYVTTSSREFVGLEELEDLIVKTFIYSKLIKAPVLNKKEKCMLC
ncbi:rho family member [Naegleria gruberi]|uniref:Rho family member n=1 Tax=Naegleria gruberi TaxID=5762 RepID=D2V0A5_NAEGR|nr:rho family member [Naegleria gruberi]EFC49682.1 rho family member [Naegleria gruberi]|eukprot:XP_002682426.1 rho family member [Naegleria gruberi strain NEG-M]